eukprot:CAMPEP_0170213174 /NCGR_PEP_ID=MMETSP0116_2-20130129/6208_1 /TAXON_ID=400756 /ORGANISM="Durinskia baltica, Strain CSIRO CS-38" /LENGTH=104 /DNA_ID=CAMNT_0010463719 /DNA_START=64 /DNA_END=378 /DNA_ORIENTATION=+
MKSALALFTAFLVAASCLIAASAFSPKAPISMFKVESCRGVTHLNVFDEKERKALTRDSEPQDYFQTNTDKMSDEEKLPIAVAGLVGISLPFILGLIALYAAKG